MSMQRIANYGSYLQAFALKRLIESFGHEVVFVDYRVQKPLFNSHHDLFRYYIKKSEKRVFRFVSHYPGLCQMFPKSIKKSLISQYNYEHYYLPEINVSKKKNYNEPIDILIVGSDEVFNCTQSNPDVGYSLDLFGNDNNAFKVISFAASFGNTTLNDLYHFSVDSEIASLLEKFDAISVRDQNSSNIVKTLTNKTPVMLLDPVLLFDFSNYVVNCQTCEKYCVVYAYKNRLTEKEISLIKHFSSVANLKVVCIGGVQSFGDNSFNGSPIEVLSKFSNAECIFTDTFHGTIFSIINEKPFISFIREGHGNTYGNQEKLGDLLYSLGLQERIYNDGEDVLTKMYQPIDYLKVNNMLNEERKKALDYLYSNLYL